MSIKPFSEQGHYTVVHDAIFDELMPRLSPNKFKILMLILRKTRGWKKESDRLGVGQIMRGTGIKSDRTVRNCLKEMVDHEHPERGLLVEVSPHNSEKQEGAEYAVNEGYEMAGVESTTPVKNTTHNNQVPQEPKSKNQSTSVEKDSLQSSFSTRGIANQEEQTEEQESSSPPEGSHPAKAMTALTIDRCTEVGFDPAPHQRANWGSGWSKYLYVEEGADPPEPEEAYAVFSEIVATAAGQRGKGRYWLSVQDAIKRVRDDGTALGGKDRDKERDKERRRRGGSAIWLTQEDLAKPDLYASRF